MLIISEVGKRGLVCLNSNERSDRVKEDGTALCIDLSFVPTGKSYWRAFVTKLIVMPGERKAFFPLVKVASAWSGVGCSRWNGDSASKDVPRLSSPLSQMEDWLMRRNSSNSSLAFGIIQPWR